MFASFSRSLCLAAWACVVLPLLVHGRDFDVIIRHAHIVDGTGSPWYSGDIGIVNGRIAQIGELSNDRAPRDIDARGLVAAPGFIDMLGQSELSILVNPHLPSKIFQGITTEITGEGGSIAPLNPHLLSIDRAGFEYLSHLSGLDDVRRLFRSPGTPWHRHQSRQLCRRDTSAPASAAATAIVLPPRPSRNRCEPLSGSPCRKAPWEFLLLCNTRRRPMRKQRN